MPRAVVAIAAGLLTVGSGPAVVPPAPDPASVVRLAPELDRLVPPDARLEVVARGFEWIEGPAWSRAEGHLLFSDIPRNTVYRWKEGEGVSVFLKPSGYTGREPFRGREPGSNGLIFDLAGRLVLCEHGDRRIRRIETSGQRVTLADRYRGRRLNSPNDIVVRSNGDLYFTDPPFGLPGTFDDPGKELEFQGVYRLPGRGRPELLTAALRAPNGIAFSPDERLLYVSDVDPARPAWWAFPVRPDGALGAKRLLVDARPFTATQPGGPDGLEVDAEGHLFAAGPGGVYVFTATGRHLGTLLTGAATGNVEFGDDGHTLYVTAADTLYRIRLTTRGARWP